MLFSDSYKSIELPAAGSYKDRGSKFLGFAYPVQNEEQCMTILQQLKKEHAHAAHHCFAFILGKNGELQKFNDDREPANTAGRPILRVIQSKQLTRVMIVVVRYFGGKLLGVPGLIQAYESAAVAALEAARIVEVVIHEVYELTVSYEHEHDVFRLIKQFDIRVLSHHHGDTIQIRVVIRKSKADSLLDAIRLNHHLSVKFIEET